MAAYLHELLCKLRPGQPLWERCIGRPLVLQRSLQVTIMWVDETTSPQATVTRGNDQLTKPFDCRMPGTTKASAFPMTQQSAAVMLLLQQLCNTLLRAADSTHRSACSTCDPNRAA